MKKSDFYAILKVDKDATKDDIELNYRRLALKWHPAKNPEKKEKAETKFKDISMAYEALISDEVRKHYDEYGVDGLKSRGLKPSDPISVFTKVFGPNNDIDVVVSEAEILDPRRIHTQDPPVSTEFQCTLEQLYGGTVKVFDVTKNIYSEDGSVKQEKKRINIKVKPGWRSGTKIIFEKQGDEHPGRIPGDMIFVVKETDHNFFKRDGSDLVYAATITLKQALRGLKLHLPFLDGSTKTIMIPRVISPDYVHKVEGFGMPIGQEGFGDMYIKFKIQFPEKLNEEQRDYITRAFEDKYNIHWR